MLLKCQNPGAKRFIASAIIILCLCCIRARAQYRFDSWTTDDGLPQNSVGSIVQTADGYLWFTTLDGLVRFDGVNFKVFSKSNSPNLTTNRLRNVLADGDTLWITTEDRGLIRRLNGEFKTFTATDGLPTNSVNEIQKDADGSLLIFGASGIARTRDGGASFALEREQESAEYHVYIASESGTRWEINKDGLFATNGGQTVRYRLPFEPKPLKFNTAFNFYSQIKFFEDKQGTLWLGTVGGIARYKDDRFVSFTEKDGLAGNYVPLLKGTLKQ